VGALKSGAFSQQVSRGLGPDAKADLDTRRAQILADKGGRESLSQLTVDGIEKAVTVHALLNHVGNKLVADGLFGERGRPRPALAAYCQLLDRWVRLATLLGLERRPKDAQTLDAYLRSNYPPQDVPENVPGHAQDSTHATNATPDDCQAMSGSDRAVGAIPVASVGQDGDEDQ
jgi:hypothetical protein